MKLTFEKRRMAFFFGAVGLILALLSGCVIPVPRHLPVYSENVEVDYERGKLADRIRVSPGFWTAPETFGWMAVHYFRDRVAKPGGVVGSTVWLIEYDERTGEREETLYWAPRDRVSFFLDQVRYSEGIFVHIGSRHQSEVIEKGKNYFISPGNRLSNSDETGRHNPFDFAHGLHISAQSYSEIVGVHEGGIPKSAPVGVEIRLYDVAQKEMVNRILVRDVRLLASGLEARLIDPDTIFFCRPYIEKEDGESFRSFDFYLFRIPERELVPYGSLRVRAYNYLGWDISPDAQYLALGAVDVFEKGRPTIVWKRSPDTGGPVSWEEYGRFPPGVDPVFSPDGTRFAHAESSSWSRNERGGNQYFDDQNPQKGFRFYELERTEE